jgi:hypothetical protein
MTSLSFPELHRAFQDFVATNPSGWDDFERLDPEDTLGLIPDKTEGQYVRQIDAFEAIGMMNASSLIAFWQESGPSAVERPIVYIDSEGSPTAVFAGSFADFLTLLPYGTRFLYKVINQSERARANPALLGIRFQPITLADAQVALEFQQHKYPQHAQYVEWLTIVAGLVIAPDPVALMEQAYQQHTSLEKWLNW